MALRLTLVIALAIAALTLTPPGAPQPGMPGFDKLVHMLAFAVLAMPMAYARRLAVWQVVLASLAFGGMIELIQPFVGRSGEWADLLADGLGASGGAWVAARVGRGRVV
ncbi:VanZ family protein [uncultured Roseovarius sp.]|uniref:VanZ family protein n=1 Tax=Roseovarius sp. TaxID=1486281 RepID=UPI0025CC5CE0|nr:VanZ family protein [uncultured Roseovarius sp.]